MTSVGNSRPLENSLVARNYLFVPADQPRMLEKAIGCGADALIIDLEDSVAPSQKVVSRKNLQKWLTTLDPVAPELWVRVNGDEELLAGDLEAVCCEKIVGLVIPKVSSRSDLESLEPMLASQEEANGMERGAFSVVPLIECAAALVDLVAIAEAPRVYRLMIGEADLGAELWIDPADSQSWHPIRMALVVASASAGLRGPIGPVVTDFRNLDVLETLSNELVRIGFRSGAAIHPDQLPVIERVFTPSPEEYERAIREIALYEEALANGRGAIVGDAGEMIDHATIKRSRRIAETRRS